MVRCHNSTHCANPAQSRDSQGVRKSESGADRSDFIADLFNPVMLLMPRELRLSISSALASFSKGLSIFAEQAQHIEDEKALAALKKLQPPARKLGPDAILKQVRGMSESERRHMSEYIDEHFYLSPILTLDKYTKIRDRLSLASRQRQSISPEELAVKVSFIFSLSIRKRRNIVHKSADGKKHALWVDYHSLQAFKMMPPKKLRSIISLAVKLGGLQNETLEGVKINDVGALELFWKPTSQAAARRTMLTRMNYYTPMSAADKSQDASPNQQIAAPSSALTFDGGIQRKIVHRSADGKKHTVMIQYASSEALKRMPPKKLRRAVSIATKLGNVQSKILSSIEISDTGKLEFCWSPASQPIVKRITLKRADGTPYTVRFAFQDRRAQKKLSPARFQHLCNMLKEINLLIPGDEVTEVEFTVDGESKYSCLSGDIRLNVESEGDAASIFAHEMGHAVYVRKLIMTKDRDTFLQRMSRIEKGPDDEEYNRLASMAHNNDSYEIVDDSNYSRGVSSDAVGHPKDNRSELFASSFAAYYLHPAAFSRAISNPELPEDWREFGKAMWAFQRDKVWKGHRRTVFTADGRDPFAGATSADFVMNELRSFPFNLFVGLPLSFAN